MAGKNNDCGLIYFEEHLPYTDEMLSVLFSMPINTIRLAIQTFQKFGMLEITTENKIFLTNWEKYQATDELDRLKKLNKEI